jgi:hypothetical protein
MRLLRQGQRPEGRVRKPLMPMRTGWSFSRVLLAIAATLVVVLGVAVAAGYFFVLLPADENQTPSLDAVHPYAEHYVRLLNAGDEKGLRELLGDPSAPDDAARRIAAYRGLGLRDVHTALSDDLAGCSGDLPWLVTIKARTSAGTVVTMEEVMDWTYESSPRLKMLAALSDKDSFLVGTWRVRGSTRDGLMRVRWIGGANYSVEFARFFRAPKRFISVDSNWRTSGGDPPGVIRYVPKDSAAPPDVILLDLVSNTVSVTDGRSRQTASLVPVQR